MERPPSATTSKMSVTGRRDFGMKFIADMDDLTGSTINAGSAGQPPVSASYESVKAAYEGSPYWEGQQHPEPPSTTRHHRQEEEVVEEEGYHPFWTAWWDILRGMGLIIAGALKIPFTIGHGFAKALHFTPTLYRDETVRKWPQITGFPSSIVAAVQYFLYGLLDGLTDWFVLPYKCAKKDGFLGVFKGFFQGLGSIVFKIGAGTIGLATHPFYGIYKEVAKFKVEFKRERRPRQDVGDLI
ncbi:hypothetical protein F4811DRAFT_553741 [Daldinia bambusicola]|nr:hypothetical protein F4811DRAFT_553741 [Daldinia bambusicola]